MPTGSSLPLIRLPGLEYPANAKLDFAPMERALARHNEAGFRQEQLGLDRERLGLQRQSVGLEGERLGLARRAEDRTDQDRRVTELAGWATRLNEIEDETHRRNIWERRVMREPRLAQALTNAGVDPADYRNGPGFLMAQAQDYERNRYMRAQTEATEQRGEARMMDAETRRLRQLYDQFQERLGDNPDEATWNQENQPGGLIHRVFGRPVPFDQAPSFVQQVQERRSQVLSDEELAAARAIGTQQRELRDLYGAPPRNYRWRPDGSVEPIPGFGTASERGSRDAARRGLAMLAEAERMLERTGTIGQFVGDRWTLPILGIDVGGWGEGGRGFRAAEGSIMQLVFALSGKQTTNAEREAFLRVYMPRSTDSRETQQWKMQQVRSFFEDAAAAHRLGADDRQLRDLVIEHTDRGQRGPPQVPTGDRQPPAGQQQRPQTPPPVGTVVDGWRFKGGNPADRNNWERAR